MYIVLELIFKSYEVHVRPLAINNLRAEEGTQTYIHVCTSAQK